MIRPLRTALLAAAALLPLAFAAPAQADSFYFGYSSGGWHSRPWYGRHDYHRHKHRHGGYYSSYYYGPPPFRPRVVVVNPPPIAYYTPPPPVFYAPAPYGGAPVSAAPASPVFQTTEGRYCREYQAAVTIDGRPHSSFGTACLGPDGAWRIVE